MALPLIKKTVEEKPLPRWQALFAAFSFIVLLVGVGGGLWTNREEKFSADKLQGVSARLADVDREALAVIEKLGMLKADLGAVKTLIDGHVNPSGLLEFFEAVTLPGVHWKTTAVSLVEPLKIELQGVGATFSRVAEEVERLRLSELVGRVKLVRAALGGDGRVDFTLEVVPDPKIWRTR